MNTLIRLKGKNISVGGKTSSSSSSLGSTSKKNTDEREKSYRSTSSVPGVLTNTNLSNLPITIDLDPLLYGIAEDTLQASVRAMSRLYVDMYYYDPIAGSTVDLYSCLPFSEFTIGGISDPKIADIFYENVERLNIRTLPNEISVDYLVLGTFLASLLYNREKKIFFDVMPHNIGNAEVSSLPFYSQDPIITVTFPDQLRAVLSRESPRIAKIKERLGPALVEKLMSGSVELDPLGSLYVPRKTFSTTEGTSFYKRILPIYLIEKNLYRGTLVESMRRQRGILHITLGDGDQWEPTLDDMESVTDLFLNADADPLGAVITTRMGVSTEELRQGGDFWKWTDIVDQTSAYKMRALGISESFLSGDSTYACVAGNTLVPTSRGILPIAKIGRDKGSDLQDINMTVASRFGEEKAIKWLNAGNAATLVVTTDAGMQVTCTEIHRFLRLNMRSGTTEWVESKNLHIGDYICSPASTVLREENFSFEVDGVRYDIDEDIAYLTGCLLKKSYYANKTIKISLNHQEVADKLTKIILKKFGHVIRFEGESRICAEIKDEKLIATFDRIGCLNSIKSNILLINILRTGKRAQLSFLAALIDCSNNGKISVDSVSALKAVHLILTAHGIMSNFTGNAIYMLPGEAYSLVNRAKEFCLRNDYSYEAVRKWYGLPLDIKGMPNFLTYDKYEYGDYDELLKKVEKTDPSIANNLSLLLKLKYRYVKVSNIRDGGVQQVFDLTMEKEPAYVANGLITHNTMESSMTVFVETLRSYRDMMTRKIFYNKLFPLISVVHGLRVKDGKIIRSESPKNTEDALEILQDGSKLLIPIVHWNKQLKPEGDTAYLDILDRMTAAGVPVPLRIMAAAGGFNLDELMVQKDDDIDSRKKIKTYMEEIAKINPPKQEGGGEGGEEDFEGLSSSALISEDPTGRHRSAVRSKKGNPILEDRDFDPEIVGRTRTGKKRLILDQKSANIGANNKIVKAMRSIAKNKNTPLTRKTTTEKKP